MKRLAILAIILCAWVHLAPAHAQFNGCSSFCGTSSSAIADAPGFNNIQASGAPAFVGVGDINGTPAHAYALRGYNAAYTGKALNACTAAPVCADINIVSGGGLDTVALGTLGCNNTTTICNVATLYDQPNQAGTPNNVVQATVASRPILVVPGAANGCPSVSDYCLNFNASGSNLTSASAVTSIAAPFTISFVAKGTVIAMLDTNNGNEVSLQNTLTALISSGGSFNATTIGSAFNAVQNISNGASSSIFVNGTNTPGTVVTTGAFNGAIAIQSTTGANFIVESYIWSGDKSANNAAINSNQHTYWGF